MPQVWNPATLEFRMVESPSPEEDKAPKETSQPRTLSLDPVSRDVRIRRHAD